ncbi:hypothetical protein DBR43_09535 [Pedobacter sp. KBW06]|uniref:nucleotidyl transferase AbiEii/AbiGii toxin family protein n=1 Tax=Pedobacter sp. KBW06 TaxID=2153359 RepID=UPI000F5B6F20|nr:nucleotidyl transferase AbiEii/AbiGii toxin family protein [Pedobacter sp. KBW06]RQO75569.1 hypothetical protein DBR43_09535 [Pedobacter sp. KBW06]
MTNLETLNQIKKITITSLVEEDDLMDILILKGGNAISMGYGLGNRASYDLDYSLEEDFEDINEVQQRLEKAIEKSFLREGYIVIDFIIKEKPKTIKPDLQKFWGGYCLEFKLITIKKFEELGKDMEKARRNALALNPDNSTRFTVDISKFEYIGDHKTQIQIDGTYLYVYAPELIVFEKIRALAQKLPEYYTDVLQQSKARLEDDRARARDFYDIHQILEHFQIDITTESAKETLRMVFEAKRVPINYIKRIRSMEDIHRQGYPTVADTISRKDRDMGFDFYFNYVMDRIENLFE